MVLGRIGGREASRVLAAVILDRKHPSLARHMAAGAMGALLDRSGGRAVARIFADLDWCALTSGSASRG